MECIISMKGIFNSLDFLWPKHDNTKISSELWLGLRLHQRKLKFLGLNICVALLCYSVEFNLPLGCIILHE